METHSCKFCPRSFPSGRSLGGHMRSHVMMLSSSHNDENSQIGYGLRENPQKSCRFDETGESVSKLTKLCTNKHFSEMEIEEEDDEGESLVLGRKSKLVGTIPASSSSPEYGALCLMMLSRAAASPVTDLFHAPKRSKSEFLNIGLKKVEFFSSEEPKKGMKFSVLELGKSMKSSGEDFQPEIDNPYKRSRYDCLICNKSFRSYQALGGHCSSHKKSKQYNTSSVSRRKEELLEHIGV